MSRSIRGAARWKRALPSQALGTRSWQTQSLLADVRARRRDVGGGAMTRGCHLIVAGQITPTDSGALRVPGQQAFHPAAFGRDDALQLVEVVFARSTADTVVVFRPLAHLVFGVDEALLDG